MANEEVRLEGLETIENSAKKVADVVDANNGFLNHQKNMPKNVLVFFCCFVLNDRMWRNTKKTSSYGRERQIERERRETTKSKPDVCYQDNSEMRTLVQIVSCGFKIYVLNAKANLLQ